MILLLAAVESSTGDIPWWADEVCARYVLTRTRPEVTSIPEKPNTKAKLIAGCISQPSLATRKPPELKPFTYWCRRNKKFRVVSFVLSNRLPRAISCLVVAGWELIWTSFGLAGFRLFDLGRVLFLYDDFGIGFACKGFPTHTRKCKGSKHFPDVFLIPLINFSLGNQAGLMEPL